MSIGPFMAPLVAAAAILSMTARTGEDSSVQTTETRAPAIPLVRAFSRLTPGATSKTPD